MSNVRLKFDGLTELRAALRNLPADLTGEASLIVAGAANGAAAVMKGEYPVRTTGLRPGPRRTDPWYPPGNLRDGVRVTHLDKGKFSAGAILKNTAKHAYIFEYGSAARHYFEASGKQHNTGAMWGRQPPKHVFISAMVRARRRMYEQLAALMRRHGLDVTGTP